MIEPDCRDSATWNETTRFGKVRGGASCQAISAPKETDVIECKGRNLAIANRSRQNAISVLSSCRDLFEHVTITIDHGNVGEQERNRWRDFYQTPEMKIQFSDQRYAFVTKTRIGELLEIMERITFMEDNSEQNAKVFAYVFTKIPEEQKEHPKVYLCNQFWHASDDLQQDCKIGTLIHEVSHLIGTQDITYARRIENDIFELEHVGRAFKLVCYLGKLGVWNANNVEYEFELDLCHTGVYSGGKWDCCGTTERYSVCYHRMHTFTPMLSYEALPEDVEKVTLEPLDIIVDGVQEIISSDRKLKGEGETTLEESIREHSQVFPLTKRNETAMSRFKQETMRIA